MSFLEKANSRARGGLGLGCRFLLTSDLEVARARVQIILAATVESCPISLKEKNLILEFFRAVGANGATLLLSGEQLERATDGHIFLPAIEFRGQRD